MKSTKQPEQPVNYSLEDQVKIKKYGRLINGLIVLSFTGVISAFGPMFYEMYVGFDKPKITQTYQNAQTSLQTLQNIRKNLTNKVLNFPYKTSEIEEIREIFEKKDHQRLSKLDKVITSTETAILKIENNPELIQYQQDKKALQKNINYSYFGGFLAMTVGLIGGMILDNKKRRLENKFKK